MKIGKKMKKLVAIAISATMVMAMAVVPAFAASDYTIDVENSIGGSTYSAYKVFDATGTGDPVSYTIDSSSAWYSAVSSSSLFTLTQSGSTSTYYVTTEASDSDIIAFFNTTYTSLAGSLTAAATADGTGGKITLDVGEEGYYYVTTSQGATASITTAAPTATIVDKNQTPGEGGKDPQDPDWEGGFTKDADGTSYSVGDKVDYVIKSYVPTYDGDKLVGTYTITDTMGEGLTYDDDMTVKIIGSGLTDYEDITSFCTITLDSSTNTLTIVWSPAEIEAENGYTYPSDAVVTIEYTDTVNELGDDEDLTNAVGMTWTRLDPTTDEPDPDDPDPGKTDDNPDVTVYTYGFDLKKTNADGDVLTGAQFSMQGADGSDILFLYDATSDTYEVWDGSASGTTTTTITVADGELNIWGLAAGTYTLTELVAPDGYNLLTSPVTITITETDTGWTVTVGDTTANGVIDSTAEHGVTTMPTITVVNAPGTLLPGTGGMGTALIIIIGCAIVACGVVVVVSRRRRVA